VPLMMAASLSPTTLLTTSLLSREEIHPGLVCLNVEFPHMSLQVQAEMFGEMLDHLGGDDPVNEALEISRAADGKTDFARYPLAQGFPLPSE